MCQVPAQGCTFIFPMSQVRKLLSVRFACWRTKNLAFSTGQRPLGPKCSVIIILIIIINLNQYK